MIAYMKNLKIFIAIVFCTMSLSAFTQQYTMDISINVEPTIENNFAYYDVCAGDTITFSAIVNGLDNPDDSIQDDFYYWYKVDGRIVPLTPFDTVFLETGRIFNYVFEDGGSYFILCKAINNSGDLIRSNSLLIRVSMQPTLSVSSDRESIYCIDTEVELTAEAPEPERWQVYRYGATSRYNHGYIGMGEMPPVTSPNPINEFNRTDTIRSGNDIDHVSIKIEHSYFGNLDFMLECPTGKKCLLHAYADWHSNEIFVFSNYNWTNTGGIYLEGSKGGRIAHLGIAIDPNYQSDACYYNIGEGYVYDIYSNGTVPFGINSPKEYITHSDTCGNIYNDSVVMQGQHYGPYESMESLVGCPLNGNWKLHITDYETNDNGYLFEWGIFFSDNILFGYDRDFTTTYDVSTSMWSGEGITNEGQGSLTATALVPATNEGSVQYTFSITDNSGCTHATTIDVNVQSAIPEIETVSINTENHVVVSWTPLEGYGTQAYHIYRERDSRWLLAGVIPVSGTNYWIDEMVDPSEQSYRYRMTSVDECGESEMSDIRQTLFLSIISNDNGNWELSWSNYEASSTDLCIIYRGFSPVTLDAIDTIAADMYSYTDTTALENIGYFYQIEILQSTRNLTTMRSNIIDNGLVLPFTITAEPEADSLGSVTGGGEYYAFNKATLFAVPAEGYHFVSWDDGNTENPRLVNVLCDSTFIALFAPGNPCYYISAYSLNPNMGIVTGGGTFEAGTTISLEAIPNDGYIFDSWSDGSQDNPREIVVTCDATYIALFDLESGTDKNLNSNITLFPNPTSSLLNIVSPEIISSIEIISSAGKVISKVEVEKFDISLDVEYLKAGIYFLRIIGVNNQDSQILRFAKE